MAAPVRPLPWARLPFALALGGAALLVFFLGVQPIGVGIEEGARDPSRTWLRGEWKRSRPLGDEEKVGEPARASQR